MIQSYSQEDSPYSLGTTPIFNKILETLTSREDDTDIVAINLSTILRNVSSNKSIQDKYKHAKEKSLPFDFVSEDIINDALKESQKLIEDITEIFKESTNPLMKYIYLYYTDYGKFIPKNYLIEKVASKQHVALAEDKLKLKFPNIRDIKTKDKITTVTLYTCKQPLSPYRILEKEIYNLKNKHNMIMISHHPCDYHIARAMGTWKCIKSFTGEVVTFKMLGEKIFGYPFLSYTEKLNILLGDKVDIKQAVNNSVKKEILKVAEKESWNLKSKDYTDKMLAKMRCIPPFNL